MNKKLLYIGITLLIVGMMIAPVSAIVTMPTTFKDIFFKGIWTAIMDLQKQITNIKTTPGPTGPTGPTGAQGPMGPAGKDGAQGPAGTGATVHFGDKAKFGFESHTAATDGFVYATAYADKEVFLRGFVNDETVCIDSQENAGNVIVGASCTFPVKAGQSWSWFVLCQGVTDLTKCDSQSSVSWMPLVT